MRVSWAFLCRNSAIDIDTNSISLFNIIEEISIPSDPPPSEGEDDSSLPMALGSCELVIASTRTNVDVPEQLNLRVLLNFPTDTPPEIMLEASIDLSSTHRSRIRLGMPGLPISGVGTYRFAIETRTSEEVDWYELHHVPFEVSQQTQDVG